MHRVICYLALVLTFTLKLTIYMSPPSHGRRIVFGLLGSICGLTLQLRRSFHVAVRCDCGKCVVVAVAVAVLVSDKGATSAST